MHDAQRLAFGLSRGPRYVSSLRHEAKRIYFQRSMASLLHRMATLAGRIGVVLALAGVLAACGDDSSPTNPEPPAHPRMMYAPEHKALLARRVNTPPFDALWQR